MCDFVCGEDFCAVCGECLHCYGGDPCVDGLSHVVPSEPERFDVILVDPPWSYTQYRTKAHGAASASYECMSLWDIGNIPVRKWLKPRSCVALWITGPMLAEGAHTELFDAWEITPKTIVPWLKNSPTSQDLATGVGIWFQGNAEYVVFGVSKNPGGFDKRRGKLGVLVGDRDHPEFWKRISERGILAPKAKKHSRKPDTLHEYLETFGGDRLELFATQEREGWTCWGLDTGYKLSEKGVECYVPSE